MHPVLAPAEIQISEVNRRQLLADAERRRLIKIAATTSGDRRRSVIALRRLRDGVVGIIATVARFHGAPSAPLGDESAAIRSA